MYRQSKRVPGFQVTKGPAMQNKKLLAGNYKGLRKRLVGKKRGSVEGRREGWRSRKISPHHSNSEIQHSKRQTNFRNKQRREGMREC